MCQNEPNPESQIKDFRGFSSLRELGNAANGIFYSSQCWESRFSLISCFPPWRKVDFRWFLIFPREGKPIFADFWFSPVRKGDFQRFWFSPVRERWFLLFSCFPPWWKVDFCCFLVFPRGGKPIFADFWFSLTGDNLFSPIFIRRTPTKASFLIFRSSYPYETLFLPIFVHRTPTKASFYRFSFVVPLRKPLFPVFRSSYPYESLLLPFFINCTLYLSDFSRKLMIYARIWIVFLIEQFRIVDFQKGIWVLTQPLMSL